MKPVSSLSSAFSPYTYVRTAVMRSLLFRKLDYHKMLKMSSAEIAKFLQEAHYRKEISALALKYHGEELLEKAVSLNLGNTFRKLIVISREPLASFIGKYAMRKDVDDLKTILRGKFTSSQPQEIINALTLAGFSEPETMHALARKNTIAEVIRENGLFSPERLAKALNDALEKKTMEPLEWQLDFEYYREVFSFVKGLEDNNAVSFLYSEVEVANIMRLLRMKKAGIPGGSIKEHILLTGRPSIDRKMERLMQKESLDGVIAELANTGYKDAAAKGVARLKETGSLVHLEIELNKHLYNTYIHSSHRRLMSTDTILAFMFAKEMEARNIRILVKGKQLKLPDDFIESQMVI